MAPGAATVTRGNTNQIQKAGYGSVTFSLLFMLDDMM